MRRGGIDRAFPVTAFLSFVALTGVTDPAFAQNPQAPTTPITPPPGRPAPIPSRPELTQPVQTAPARTRARVRDQEAFAEAPCPLNTSDIRVTINSVVFDGIGGAPLPGRVRAALKGVGPTASGEVPIADVCHIRDNANAALHRAGFIATVQFPASNDLSTHVLRLTVVTAHFVNGVRDIHVHGDAGPNRHIVDERIAQLAALDPLNQFDAERILLEARDIPGLDVSLSLRSAGTTPGAVIGDLVVTRRPYDVLANVQNYGSKTVGPETAFVRAEFYGLTGHADETYVGLSNTVFQGREQRIAQLGELVGIGKHGDTFGASLIYAKSQPDLGALDLRTDSSIFNVEYVHPLMRAVGHQLRLTGGLDIVEQKTRTYSGSTSAPVNLDKLRIAYLGFDGDMQRPDPFGGAGFMLRGDVAIRQGMDILDATQRAKTYKGYNPSLPEGDPKALVVRADADTTIGIGRSFSLAAKLQGQWANHPLLSYEQYSIGNLSIGRGYDPGANSGDSVVAGRLELRGQIRRAGDYGFGEYFTFYDAVHLSNLAASSTERRRVLESIGVGMRYYLPQHLVGEIMFAQPLDKALSIDAKRAPARMLISVTMQFGPRPQ